MSQDFYGRVRLILDDKALSAKMVFVPDKNGETHNIDTLRQILQKENVKHGINEVALKDTAEDFFDAIEETESDPVAEGEAPTSGEGDVYDFSSMSYSPELKQVADKILSINKAPQIYSTIKTTVKKDRRVKDKGLFKGGKEKFIVVEEQIEKKIRIEVSNTVLKMGYFRQGALVCTIERSTGSEAPGKDIHGNVLEPLPVSKDQFFFGKNIRKEKNELFAEVSGFVRKGENWMDLVPFETHNYSVRISENRADCLLDFTAGHNAAPLPELASLKASVEEKGYPLDNLLSDDKILSLIRMGCQSEGSQTFGLTQDRNSESDIEINSLGTEAKLHLKKGSGKGRSLNLKKIWQNVLALKIKEFEAERVKREILDFNSSDQFEISIFLAEGENPERGKDRELVVDAEYIDQDKIDFILERMEHLRKIPDSFGEFPKESIEKMALVKKGSAIFHLGKQNGGKNGRDIFGKTIEGIEGNDPVVRLYENIQIQEGKAISAIDGILDYSSRNSIYSLRIRKHTDSRILVSISEDKMKASLSILPPEGSGCLPTKESLIAALEEKGVVEGISEKTLNLILERTGREELVTDEIVAEGKIPIQDNEALKLLIDIQMDQTSPISVEEGDLIGEIVSYDEGDSIGLNVMGESFSEDENNVLKVDEHFKIEESENGKQLIAGVKGLLCIEDNRLIIRSKKVFKGDVSRTNGNIQFPGTIEILGSVLSGIFIKAGNDLKVRDVVEASLLSSSGSILIGKGVKGDRKAVLRSNKDINLGFAENTNLMSNGNIVYKKALMNCQIKCNGRIVSQSGGTRILGGRIKVKNGLSADSIGSERGAATFISFGQDYLVEDQINVMNREIEQLNSHLESLEGMMKAAEHKGQHKKLMGLRKKKFQYLKIQEKKVVKNFLMKDKFELHFESEVKVCGTIFPGTVFESHGRKLEVKEKLTSQTVFFDSQTGKIATKQI